MIIRTNLSHRARLAAEAILIEQVPRLVDPGKRKNLSGGELGGLHLFALDIAALGRGEIAGRRVGWRFLWRHPAIEDGAVIDLHRTGARPAFRSFSWGGRASALAAILRDVANIEGQEETRFRVGILSSPSLGLDAVWVRSKAMPSARLIDLPNGEDVASEIQSRLASRRRTENVPEFELPTDEETGGNTSR
jgi:hypothetical protein